MATWVRAAEVFTADASQNPVSPEPSSFEMAEDDDLVRSAQKGDRAAFGRLYEKYARMVHGLLLAKIPTHEVDDLTQDVFMKAMGRLSTLRERGKFGGWLAAIARNLANDYYRRVVPEEALSDDVEGSDPADPCAPSDQYDAARVLDIIRGLPEAYRETLILRLVEGMTGPEIAARTGMTAGSVRVNLHRGMEQLREKLSPQKRKADGEAL